MKINIEIDIAEETINDALTGACEGGSNYWARPILHAETPKNFNGDGRLWWHLEYRASISFKDLETGAEYFITYENVESGLKYLCLFYSDIFGRLLDGNADAGDYDCFVQACVLGDIVYG